MNSNGSQNQSRSTSEGVVFPWQRGWLALKAIWPQMVYISVGTIAIPQCILSWYFSMRAAEVGSKFEKTGSDSLNAMLGIMEHFSSQYFAWLLCVGCLGVLGYFSVVALSLDILNGQNIRLMRSLKTGLKTLFPSGLLGILVASGLLLSSFQLFLFLPGFQIFAQFFLLILSVLLLAWPVLLVQSPRKPVLTLMRALKLTYVEGSGVSKWSVFFTLLTYQMALLTLISLINLGEISLVELDQRFSIPRALWVQSLTFAPFGIPVLCSQVIGWILLSVCSSTFAVFSTSFIFDIKISALKRISRIEILV